MCDQLRLLLGSELVDKHREAKLERLRNRLDEEAKHKRDVIEAIG
jgi:hypothetical protein